MQKHWFTGSIVIPCVSACLVAACGVATNDTDTPDDIDAGAGKGGSGGRGGSGGTGGGSSTGRGGTGGYAGRGDAGPGGTNGQDAGRGDSNPDDAPTRDAATGDGAIGEDARDAGTAVDASDATGDTGDGRTTVDATDARAADANGDTNSDAAIDGGGGTTTDGCPLKLEGWATTNANNLNGTTGGGNVAPTKVTTFDELKAAVQAIEPRVIIVSGTIKTTDGGGSGLEIASNKTIVGADKNATIYGGISLNNVSNIIVRNLNFHGIWPNTGPDDTIASRNSHHIWWDHLNIWDAGDGALDITNQSSYQTVSWCKFWYTNKDHPHRLASLNGSGGGDHPEDEGYLKVTYHHNWWSTLVDQRMPRVMYGQGHQYNNYFNAPDNLYCIGVGSYGAVLVENNYFKNVNDPHVFMYTLPMSITARGNVYDNITGNKDNGAGGTGTAVTPFTDPPYDYTMDKAADVPTIVQKCAGPR
jgi:pectate lyase